MKKKISIQDLRHGMYVSELDRHWLETPFLFQGFEIKSDEQIDELKKYCQHVYIDTEQGYDVTAPKFRPPPRTSTPVEPAHNREIEFEVLNKFSPGHLRPPRYHDQSTLEQELTEAKGIVTETRATVFNIMEDVRLGRSVNTAAAKKVVADMVDSVIRNPDALVCLNQLKIKHEYTALHSLRVCVLALAFGRHLEFSDAELNLLGIGALLHDVGKMKVPNEILDKPGKLTGEEFDLMKSHVPHGVSILEDTKGILPISIEVARSHHERFDGHGYAFGAKENQIGLFGSIGAIVDCYDAITSDRSYHDGMSAHDALKKMYSWRGTDFHPQLIEQFIQCMGIYPIGSVVELSTGGVGVVVSINRKRRLKPKVALVLNSDKTPFMTPKVIDLMQQAFEGPGKEVEIRKVLSPGLFNINPSDFIPLGA
jgi:putative nucleotidyltransferase with HDIG domain